VTSDAHNGLVAAIGATLPGRGRSAGGEDVVDVYREPLQDLGAEVSA
jgi:hypothetical protein